MRDYLSHLASEPNVAGSTQNQALNALIFLYDAALDQPLGDIGNTERARRPPTLPVVLTRAEVKALHDPRTEEMEIPGEAITY